MIHLLKPAAGMDVMMAIEKAIEFKNENAGEVVILEFESFSTHTIVIEEGMDPYSTYQNWKKGEYKDKPWLNKIVLSSNE